MQFQNLPKTAVLYLKKLPKFTAAFSNSELLELITKAVEYYKLFIFIIKKGNM